LLPVTASWLLPSITAPETVFVHLLLAPQADHGNERCSSNFFGRTKLTRLSGPSKSFIWRLFIGSLIISGL
jgi:hypothetical protein